jgi:uncharacterized YigZ family protein
MTDDFFYTIGRSSEGIYKEKGSKFLAFAFSVGSEEEIKPILADFKKKYYDARHICYAYQLGIKKDQWKVNDDGEPAHTAGDPILHEIKSRGLTDTIVIVVRYFGGTKLGKSGLISAYRDAAADALNNTEIIEKIVKLEFEVEFPYDHTSEVMNQLNILEAEIVSQDYTSTCRLKAAVRKGRLEEARKKLERYFVSSKS